MQDATNPLSLPSFFACRILLVSLILHFSHNRSNWSSPAPYTAMIQMKHFTILFLNLTTILLVKRVSFPPPPPSSFFLNATFAREILDLISHVHLVSSVYQASSNTPHSTVLSIYHNLYGIVGIRFSLPYFFSTFISLSQCLPTSISLSVMPCSTISSLASHKMLLAYFTVPIICPPLKSHNLSTASLVWYKLNKISDKQHPCLSPLPVFTLFRLGPVVL